MKRYLIILALVYLQTSVFGQDDWQTYYEQSNFLETSRYKQSMDYAKKLAEASDFISYTTFGKSAQGRDLPLLIVDKNKNFTPESVKKSGNAFLLVQACIQPGESEGKDAGFMLIRDIMISKKYDDLLENTTLLFIPIFNTDGHERFSPYNRINQNGPKEYGFRGNARNFDLNRDFIKADTKNARAFAHIFHLVNPAIFIDNHVSNGADYQYGITHLFTQHNKLGNNLGEFMEAKMRPAIEASLLKKEIPITP